MASFGEGDAGNDLKWIIGIFVVLGVIWIVMGGPASFKLSRQPDGFFSAPNITPVTNKDTSSTGEISSQKTTSVSKPATKIEPEDLAKINSNESLYKDQVTVKLGQSYRVSGVVNKEYLVVSASGRNKESINISGWKIDNGYSERYSDFSGKLVVGKSSIVAIPYGTVFMTGKTSSMVGPVILAPGETAYVITGSLVQTSPYNIDVSFKTNKCSGYLEKYEGYDFVPTLSGSCPTYDKELDVSKLSDSCFSFVRRYGQSCITPKITYDDKNGEILVDGRKMSSACQSIVVSTFSYNSCLDRHKMDKDFLGKKWYIYLKHQGGLYAKERATITLYDSFGKVVDTYSY